MNEIEEIRRRKLERLNEAQMQHEMQQQAAQETSFQQQVQQLELLVKPLLAREAWARYTTLKVAHDQKAIQSLLAVSEMVHKGAIKKPMSDDEYKEVLVKLTPAKKDNKITFI